jgi:hypothetical protein
MTMPLAAGKLGSLDPVILSRTFRKNGLTVSDNDPWGMIRIPAELKEEVGPQAHPLLATAS